jgi:hypothetical protein
MRVAALPTFRKLWGRNDDDVMAAGTYRILINMSKSRLTTCADDLDYPVKSFDGTKSIVISTVSWIGGKQPFLGWAYIAAAILCVALAVAGLVRHLVRPRKLGDMNRESRRSTVLMSSSILEPAAISLMSTFGMYACLVPHGNAPTRPFSFPAHRMPPARWHHQQIPWTQHCLHAVRPDMLHERGVLFGYHVELDPVAQEW